VTWHGKLASYTEQIVLRKDLDKHLLSYANKLFLTKTQTTLRT